MLQKNTNMILLNYQVFIFGEELCFNQISKDNLLKEISTLDSSSRVYETYQDLQIFHVRGKAKICRTDLSFPFLTPIAFKKGDIVRPVYFGNLYGELRAPKFKDVDYPVKCTAADKKGILHLNVGLAVPVDQAPIRSVHTNEVFKHDPRVYWCEAACFVLVPGKTNDALQFINEDSQ